MSDSTNTNSSGSSNSWTVLTPEANEAAVENVGPQDDESASLADVSSLSEEVTGPSSAVMPSDCFRSEEGLQVCQETRPDDGQGSAPPSPTLLTPSPASHVPLLSDLGSYCPENSESQTHKVSSFKTGSDTPPGAYLDAYPHTSLSQSHTHTDLCPESSILVPTSMTGEEEECRQDEKSDVAKKVSEVGKQAGVEARYDSELGEQGGSEGEHLRKRKVHLFGPMSRGEKQVEEEEEDEEEFRPVQREQEGSGLSLNKCILAALILLGLGTILFSEEDVEVRELKEPNRLMGQEWMGPDIGASRSPEVHQLLDSLAQEDLRISALQKELQEKTEELNLALQRVEEGGKELERTEELEKENERMRMELSSLPHLQKELESLSARVMELTQIMAQEESTQVPASPTLAPPSGQTDNESENTATQNSEEPVEETTYKSDRLTNELERQKVLLQESRQRLEGMKAEGRGEQHVREGLAEMEKRLTEEVEKLGQRAGVAKKDGHVGKRWHGEEIEKKRERDGWRPDPKEQHEGGGRKQWRGEKEWKREKHVWKDKEKEWGSKEERDELRGEKEWRKDQNDDWYTGKERVENKEWRGQKDGERWSNEEKAKTWKHGRDKMEWERRRKEWPKDSELKKESWKDTRNGEWKNHKDHHKHGEGPEKMEHHRQNADMSNEQQRQAAKKRHWQGTVEKTALDGTHRHHEHNEYWKRKKQKLQNYYRPLANCGDIITCAKTEGLSPVQLPEFEALLGTYLSKLDETHSRGKNEISSLVRDFFTNGVFSHDKMSFRDFVEDLADILEDVVEGDENDEMEDVMEEFEREALRKFMLKGTEESQNGDWRTEKGRVHG